MRIDKFDISANSKPFIIAEMSGNHNHSIERATKIIEAAAATGAHAVKLQTYTADSITIDHRGGLFDIKDEKSLWNNRNLYELYQEAYTPWEWHEALFRCAKDNGIICFSTPFDDEAVDFLEKLDAPAYKIASFENNHHPLLKKVAATKKPVIMSTGISSILDIAESVKVLQDSGCKDLVLLKCTSTYPSTPANTNLVTIPVMSQMFPDCMIGLSDHTMGIGVSIASVALGARVIEKHFTLSRADGGVDSAFSMEPEEMKMLVTETERAWEALGRVQLDIQEAEKKSVSFKRSLYIVEDISAGSMLTEKNLRVIRPGDGLHPRFYEQLLGKKVKRDISKGTPFSEEYVEKP